VHAQNHLLNTRLQIPLRVITIALTNVAVQTVDQIPTVLLGKSAVEPVTADTTKTHPSDALRHTHVLVPTVQRVPTVLPLDR